MILFAPECRRGLAPLHLVYAPARTYFESRGARHPAIDAAAAAVLCDMEACSGTDRRWLRGADAFVGVRPRRQAACETGRVGDRCRRLRDLAMAAAAADVAMTRDAGGSAPCS